MSVVAKVELDYTFGKGVRITSKSDNAAWELLLASMLLESIAVKQGITIEEAAEALSGSTGDSYPLDLHIDTRESEDETEEQGGNG